MNELLSKAHNYLSVENYAENYKSEEFIIKAEKVLEEFNEITYLIDTETRCKFYKKLNEIKLEINKRSLFSLFNLGSLIESITLLTQNNRNQFNNIYLTLDKRYKRTIERIDQSKKNIKYTDQKKIKPILNEIDKLLLSQSYMKYNKADDLLNEIDEIIQDSDTVKLENLVDNLRNEIEKHKKDIWLEQIDLIISKTELMIEESRRTGEILNLNLDKFKIDQLIQQKKNDVKEFVAKCESVKKNNTIAEQTSRKALLLLRSEAHRADLKELDKEISNTKNNEVSLKKKVSPKMLFFTFLILLTMSSVVVFIMNYKETIAHNNIKGQEYADIVETMVYFAYRSGNRPDPTLIRKKILAPKSDFEILSITEKEVSVMFKGEIYKKSVRTKK